MSGAGKAWPAAGRPPGTGGAEPVDELESVRVRNSLLISLPPGLFGMAGAGLPPAGAGGGPRPAALPNDPWKWKSLN